MRVVTGEEMRVIEQRAMAELEVSGLLLMETAGARLTDLIVQVYGSPAGKRIYILAGTGNNGGDGLVVARHLLLMGARPKVYLFGNPDKATVEHKGNLDILRKLGVELTTVDTAHRDRLRFALNMGDIIIDALLGTGFRGELPPELKALADTVNDLQRPVVAVDVPTGVDANSGQVIGTAIKADLTVNLGLWKAGCFLYPGRDYCGQVKRVDLGVPLVGSGLPSRHLLDESILNILPKRDSAGHKGTFGHVLVVGGSGKYAGAPALSGQAVLRGGAGLVTLAVPKGAAQRLPADERIVVPLAETSEGNIAQGALGQVLELADAADVVVVGPGLAREAESLDVVRELLSVWEGPAVIDADALSLLQPDFLAGVGHGQRAQWVITPHPGEMARILETTPGEINQARLEIAPRFAAEWGMITVLKGSPTIVSDGKTTYINSTGSHGLATAGTGDVLAGLIGSLLAQGLQPLEAAAAGVYAHGAAGDLAGSEGQRSLIASDCLDFLPRILR